MSTTVGEIGAIMTDGRPPRGIDAERLLTGYAGQPSTAWIDGPVALASCGAASIAVDHRFAILLEGRLDNRSELIRQFGGTPEDSPAQLLLCAWRSAGPDTLDWIVGEIAGIVFDRWARQLRAFRDLCAGRPLHVARMRDGWAIASDWQPLVSAGAFFSRPDPEWFAGACTGVTVNARATPYTGVHMVMPGHVATPVSGGWRQQQYADWHVSELEDRGTGGYQERFRELFDQAVSCRLVDRRGVGVCLSGGLDSTSVIASAAAVARDIPRTALCMPMTEPEGDERDIQAKACARAGARLHWVDISQCGPMGPDGPEKVFERLGAPPLIINWSFGEVLAESASAHDLAVVLDGEDGDSLLRGQPGFFPDLIARGRLRTWVREWKSLRDAGVGGGRYFAAISAYFLAPPLLRRLHHRFKDDQVIPDFIPAGLSVRLDLKRRINRAPASSVWAPGNTFRALQRQAGHPDYLGPMLTEMAYQWRLRGIANSHPFTDRRLMSFCMGLPYDHVYRAGWSKIVLRQAMSQRLPEEVIFRPDKADISEVARRAAYGRELKYVKAGLRLAQQQDDWFDSKAVATLEASFLARPDDLDAALRVSMMGWWLRWCEAA